MYREMNFSHFYLMSLFDYSAMTGEFMWKNRVDASMQWNGRFAGSIAGGPSGRYISICINKRPYLAHRLAWFWFYGVSPDSDIDHINGCGRDNRISNLRMATDSQNLANMRKPSTNTSGAKGVHWSAHAGMWRAKIHVRKKQIYLGYFDTIEAAKAAYDSAAIFYFGEFARPE